MVAYRPGTAVRVGARWTASGRFRAWAGSVRPAGTRAFTRSIARRTAGRVGDRVVPAADMRRGLEPHPRELAAPEPAEMGDIGHREGIAGDEGALGQDTPSSTPSVRFASAEKRAMASGCGSAAWRWKKPDCPKAGPSPEAWKNSCSNTRARAFAAPSAGAGRSSRPGRPGSRPTPSGPAGRRAAAAIHQHRHLRVRVQAPRIRDRLLLARGGRSRRAGRTGGRVSSRAMGTLTLLGVAKA